MYCSACGVAVNEGLTYCNYCGANLQREITRAPGPKPDNLVAMMVATFVMGTLAITVLLGVLRAVLHLDYGPLLVVLFITFLMMFFLEGVFIKLLFRRGRIEETDERPARRRGTTRELEAQSRAPSEPVASVTENTTRAFEPVYNQRK
jgi:hypothetical protein